MVAIGPCETCGAQGTNIVNDVPYCVEHLVEGAVQQARLEAWRKGCARAVIDHAERLMREAIEQHRQTR